MPKIKQQIDTLLNKEMDRKNFLKYGGTILLGVFGVTGLLRILLGNEINSSSGQALGQKSSTGYGASRYGE